MIVAGVAVGPHGFDILSDDSSFAIFGQVGLLYLMFLAGLEIDMFHLRLNLRRGLLFGLLTLLVPLGLGVAVSMLVMRQGLITSLMLGAMYAAHTLISYPVAARLGITKAPAVLIAIVGTIIAVAGSLLVIATAVNIHTEGSFNAIAIAWLIIRMALWALAVVYLYPRVTRIFFKTYSDRVTQYVFILAMVFLAAWTAQIIGVEPVLGAFLAGLVLNRYVPHGSPLMTSIEFVGNALFIPYFLIGVGMMIDVRLVLDTDTLAAAGMMLAVALASKWIPAFVVQKANGLDSCSRNVIFGLTAAHTAVALAVVSLGYRMGVLTEVMLNATILVILVTCAVAPIITAAGATKLKISMLDKDDMIRHTRTNNSLIAVDNPLTAASLVDLGLLMRNDRGVHRFYAIHVRNESTGHAKAVSAAALDAALTTAAAANVSLEQVERYDLNTVTGILNAISERDITEVILGMHRRTTVIDTFFGSKVEQLLRSTNRMLIISRCYIPLNTVTRIIVAVPRDAQYETGFSRWVRAVARLTRQVGCRVIFCCHSDIQPLIRGVLYQENYGVRCEFRTIDSLDSMILLAGRIMDDDLFVVISARPNSVSYTDEVTEMPSLLQRNFSRNNIIVIFPEQFGAEQPLTSFTDPMSSDLSASPSPLPKHARAFVRRVYNIFRR
ncbi:MAG: cation:proton antiporter, partial [Muribaculaceae bacterium]|nr:cation:proton antiporter [Muribaculaceae bacterium]